MASVLLESRPYRPFKNSEEYLEAMREDLAEWMQMMYPELLINAENFMDRLDTGVALCKHANNVRQAAEDYLLRRQARNKSMTRSMTSGLAGPILAMGTVHYLPAAKCGTFFARDNVSNFITWCRKSLKIFECLLFETDDLIMRKNEKHVILCLLEVARRGSKFGMLAPMLVQMERQIDREIAADNKANGIGCGTQTDLNNSNNNKSAETETDLFETDTEDEDEEPVLFYGPQPQIITNDLKSLDEMVRDLVEKCTCPSQFPMVRVSEGKYRIGDTKVLIFVRILRSHVMVRVGGGWDTLSHYLDKHDPCRCKSAHRSSVAARLIPRTNQQTNGIELHKAQVIFERSPPASRKVITSPQHSSTSNSSLSPPLTGRSRSPTPQKKFLNQNQLSENSNAQTTLSSASNSGIIRRSMSPSPRRVADIRKKPTSNTDSSNKHLNGLPETNHVQFEEVDTKLEITTSSSNGSISAASTSVNAPLAEGSTKFDNISDNGSEISDEGYRSLGLVQTNAQKRESLHSQNSADDADNNGRLDQTTSSDSQLSPTQASDDNKTPEILDSTSSSDHLETTIPSPSPPKDENEQYKHSHSDDSESNKFEQSGIFITEDEITVDIASATGLRKTGYSNRIYGNDDFISLPSTLSSTDTPKKTISSKIPRSPVVTRRRGSVEDTSEQSTRTGLPVFNRKQPTYRSVRSDSTTKISNGPKSTSSSTTIPKKPVKEVTNTWSGGRNANKKRPSISNDTFTSPNHSAFDRNSKQRATTTRILYDSNGRRVKGNCTSLTTSPVKSQSSGNSSPLAQQLLEAASSAKNDAQILEKMKILLTKYSKTASGGRKNEFDDFTTAWVHSNGNLERSASSSCSPSPTKVMLAKRNTSSSAASSNDSNNSRDMSVICAPRVSQHRGVSKIPAPIRHNTELY